VSATQGFVLGTAPCANPVCTSLVRTTDGGAHWAGIPAPTDALAPATNPSTAGVSTVRFADALDGWVFGPDLWSTHDGGATWTHVTTGPGTGSVVDVEAASGHVDAVSEQCVGQTGTCRAQLWVGSVGSDAFSPGPAFALGTATPSEPLLALHGTSGYLITQGSAPGTWALLVTTDGTTWTPEPGPCAAAFTLDSIAPLSASCALALCAGDGAAGSTQKSVLATTDNGRTWAPQGSPAPLGGDGGQLAAASPTTLAVATSSAATWIYRSTDGGATWSTALQLDDGGAGWGDVGFTDAVHGLAVHQPAARLQGTSGVPTGPDPATLFLTGNGGATWSPVSF
jgi:photosystem II stability/assembly factor-like uncharacterized protein